MSSRVVRRLDGVPRAGQHGAIRPDHDGADRHLAARGSQAGFVQRDLHGRHTHFLPGHGAGV